MATKTQLVRMIYGVVGVADAGEYLDVEVTPHLQGIIDSGLAEIVDRDSFTGTPREELLADEQAAAVEEPAADGEKPKARSR